MRPVAQAARVFPAAARPPRLPTPQRGKPSQNRADPAIRQAAHIPNGSVRFMPCFRVLPAKTPVRHSPGNPMKALLNRNNGSASFNRAADCHCRPGSFTEDGHASDSFGMARAAGPHPGAQWVHGCGPLLLPPAGVLSAAGVLLASGLSQRLLRLHRLPFGERQCGAGFAVANPAGSRATCSHATGYRAAGT
jgi:hypothetical protein